ncbi:MAG: Murein hydrolase activator EnvC [Haliscomenobacter sp.]|jgi:septal ring factor EnvC (AmiA/AmiB activator)|nr:Murein hydrolase activator EnvC [Haliscomenobacter sp.]
MSLKACLLKFRNAIPAGPGNRWLAGLLLLVLVLPPSWGQSRKDLEDKRKNLLRDIQQTNTQLKNTQKEEKATLHVFLTLQNQIRNRQQLVQNLEKEISYAEESMTRTQSVLESLEEDTRQLKEEYSRMLRMAFRHKLNQTTLLFLFSAQNFNEAFRRWQYLRQYDRYRNKQARLIRETQRTLEEKTRLLAERKQEKEAMLAAMQQQQTHLKKELNEKNSLLNTLKASERKLASELSKQQEAHQKLNYAIEAVIKQEMLAIRKKARTPEAIADNKRESEAPSRSLFRQKKGALPSPLQGGEIVRQFGTHQHPKYKEVKTQSNGIDIRAGQNVSVRCVFEGRVVGIQYIPGYQNTLILQHGEYYSVYSNLNEIFVKRGDSVSAGQEIGRVSREKPELHFELWREKNRLNPEDWLSGS